ncbi:MAG: hypothetical protein N0E48_14370 [Candidatus Thiodiazotropha endolucinida]|nr:hypothetical protein [Candidatus Thiodiazotropha endolucinida]
MIVSRRLNWNLMIFAVWKQGGDIGRLPRNRQDTDDETKGRA